MTPRRPRHALGTYLARMSSCIIAADGDVAGLGVRVAFYMQALLPLVNIAVIPYSSIETADVKLVTQYCKRGNGSLVVASSTGAALLVTAFIERFMRDLSPYHALIVLNLTWMTLVSSCCRAAVMFYLQKHGIPGCYVYKQYQSVNARIANRAEPKADEPRQGESEGDGAVFSTFLGHVTVLCVHLLITGVLGWLLFRDIEGFAGPAGCPHDTVLWMFTSFLHITNAGPRLFWKVIYMTALLAPVSLPILCFLVCIIFGGTVAFISNLAAKVARRLPFRRFLPAPPSALALRAFEACCLALLALLIVSTEKTIANNPVERGEDEWGFGQILALILAAFALHESLEDLQMSRKLRTAARRPVLAASSSEALREVCTV